MRFSFILLSCQNGEVVMLINDFQIRSLEVRDSFYTDNHHTAWIYTRDDWVLNQLSDTDSFLYH